MILVHIPWAANPFRGDKFAEGWAAAAELVLDYGAVSWGFYRSLDGRLDFIQEAVFPSKAHFERYWYSEEIAEKRVAAAGLLQRAGAAGVLRDRRRGPGAQPCSSGAIVSPCPPSCS